VLASAEMSGQQLSKQNTKRSQVMKELGSDGGFEGDTEEIVTEKHIVSSDEEGGVDEEEEKQSARRSVQKKKTLAGKGSKGFGFVGVGAATEQLGKEFRDPDSSNLHANDLPRKDSKDDSSMQTSSITSSSDSKSESDSAEVQHQGKPQVKSILKKAQEKINIV